MRAWSRSCSLAGRAMVLCTILASGALGAPARPLTPLVLDFNPLLLSSGPLDIAIEEGYFAEQGIEIRPSNLREAVQSFPALLTGQEDIYTGAYVSGFVSAVLQGARLRVVADKGHVGPGSGGIVFMVRQDLIDSGRYRTFKDLQGMRIGVANRGSTHEFLLTQILRNRAILTLQEVHVQQIPSAFLPDAFRAKTLDAASVSDPFPARLESLGLAKTVLTLHDVLPRATTGIIIYGPKILARNPGLGQRFMNGYLRGVRQYNEGKTPRNVAIVQKYTTEEEALIRRIPWTLINADGHVNTASMMQIQAWWVREGWLERAVDPAQFLDMTFARQAFRLLSQTR